MARDEFTKMVGRMAHGLEGNAIAAWVFAILAWLQGEFLTAVIALLVAGLSLALALQIILRR